MNTLNICSLLLNLFLFLLIQNILCDCPSFCQDENNPNDSLSSGVVIQFKTPVGWNKINTNTFVLKDYNEELKYWEPYLKQGHAPWRYSPKNIAVTCLWNFGISDGTPVDDFAEKLIEIKKDKVYSLKIGSMAYLVYIRTRKHTPIAYKFRITDL